MSREHNKALVLALYQTGWNGTDPAAFADLVDEHFRVFLAGDAQAGEGPEVLQTTWRALKQAFPDLRFDLTDVVAEDDKVVAVWELRGTHRGPYFGIPPTGRSVRQCGISVYRVAEDKPVEERTIFDALGMLRQLGALPGPRMPS